MIAVISPAKSLDFEQKIDAPTSSIRFEKESSQLVKTLKKKKEKDLIKMMDISDNLASINVERYQNFDLNHSPEHAKQAIFAFQGDVYQGLQTETLSQKSLEYAQSHIRILSGLYGLLRPLDQIQPYRLEMGSQLKIGKAENLYQFWGDKITKAIAADLKDQGSEILINLASKEYFKAINSKKLKARVIHIEFKDFKNGKYKIISFFAKKARGMMARFMAENQLENPEELKHFATEGYYYDETSSTANKWVFLRDSA